MTPTPMKQVLDVLKASPDTGSWWNITAIAEACRLPIRDVQIACYKLGGADAIDYQNAPCFARENDMFRLPYRSGRWTP